MERTATELLKEFNAPDGARFVKQFKNGNIQIEVLDTCDRCNNNKGLYIVRVHNGMPVPSSLDNGVCWKCLGTGKVWTKKTLMTAENRRKYEEKLQRELEREQEELARREAERKAREEAERLERERKEQERLAKAKISQYVGKVKERLTLEVKLVKRVDFTCAGMFGQTEYKSVYTMEDSNGNCFTWFTGENNLGKWKDKKKQEGWMTPEEGETIVIKGTVKEHKEYRDQKQTVLNRVTLIEIKENESC